MRTNAYTHTHVKIPPVSFPNYYLLVLDQVRLDFIHPFDTNCTGHNNNSCIQLSILMIILVTSIFYKMFQHATSSIHLQFLSFNISPHRPHIFHDKYSYNRYLSMEQIVIKVFYSPTDAQVNCLKNNFKIYIKIDIKTALTCFGSITIIRERIIFIPNSATYIHQQGPTNIQPHHRIIHTDVF